MARHVSRWGVAALIACVLIGVAYLPPRGATPPRWSWAFWDRPTSSARRQAQALAEEWRRATLAVRLAEIRRDFQPEFARRRTSDVAGAALLILPADRVPAESDRIARQALDRVWHDLGLGVSKVAVGVVVDATRGRATAPELPPVPRVRAYLLPDSTDRAACLAYVPAHAWQFALDRTSPEKRAERVEDWLRAGLGPCAFYAAFGTPGAPVRQWLARRTYSLALTPEWGAQSARPVGGDVAWFRDAATQRWSWRRFGGLPFGTVACLGGRGASCAEAVLTGSGVGGSDSLPRLVTVSTWWWRHQWLLNEERFLSDVARTVGPDRFLVFWNSSLPVEPSLEAALRTPVGEWTAEWERRFVPRLPLGPTVSWFAGVTGVVLSGLVVLGAMLAAAHRQVR